MIDNVVLASGIQQSGSTIHIHLFFFKILSLFKFLQNIEQSSHCYTVGPCWLSILNIAVAHILLTYNMIILPDLSYSVPDLLLLILHATAEMLFPWENSPG